MATFSFPGLLGGLLGIAINLFTLFVVAVVWHGELFAKRPAASRLTDFYLSMSAGGVLGGAFASLLAPVVFSTITEFPLLLGLSILAIPEMRAMLFRRRGAPFLAIGAAGFAEVIVGLAPSVEYRERNFFGVLSTEFTDDGRFRLLMHGNTIHGAERVSDVGLPAPARPEPVTYFAAGSPLAEGIRLARAGTADRAGSSGSVRVVSHAIRRRWTTGASLRSIRPSRGLRRTRAISRSSQAARRRRRSLRATDV